MASIYYAVKVVAVLWILMILIIMFMGGNKSEKEDRSSKYFVMISISLIFPTIQYTDRLGEAAPGALTWGFPTISYLGFSLIGLGFLIHMAGIFTLRKQWTTAVVISEDHELIENGIYHYVRHPIYAGVLLEIVGFGLALANWISLMVMVIPNVATLAYRIYVEERALEKHFGETYVQYARKTRRLIPGIF